MKRFLCIIMGIALCTLVVIGILKTVEYINNEKSNNEEIKDNNEERDEEGEFNELVSFLESYEFIKVNDVEFIDIEDKYKSVNVKEVVLSGIQGAEEFEKTQKDSFDTIKECAFGDECTKAMDIKTDIKTEEKDGILSIMVSTNVNTHIGEEIVTSFVNIDVRNKKVINNTELFEKLNYSLDDVARNVYDILGKNYNDFKNCYNFEGTEEIGDKYTLNKDSYINMIKENINGNRIYFAISNEELTLRYNFATALDLLKISNGKGGFEPLKEVNVF